MNNVKQGIELKKKTNGRTDKKFTEKKLNNKTNKEIYKNKNGFVSIENFEILNPIYKEGALKYKLLKEYQLNKHPILKIIITTIDWSIKNVGQRINIFEDRIILRCYMNSFTIFSNRIELKMIDEDLIVFDQENYIKESLNFCLEKITINKLLHVLYF